MLFYDSLFEYFDLISQFIYLKVLAFLPSLPHSFRDVSLALPSPRWLHGEARPGLAQPHPRTPPPWDLVVRWPTGPRQRVRVSQGPAGRPRRAAAGRRVAEGQGTEREAKASCMLDPWPPKVAGSTSRTVAEPTAPSAVSATLLCRGGKRRQPGKGRPPQTLMCRGQHRGPPALKPAAPGPAPPLPDHSRCAAGSGAAPLASASPKEAGAGHPQARQHASAKTRPSPAVLRPWGWTGALRRGGDPRSLSAPGWQRAWGEAHLLLFLAGSSLTSPLFSARVGKSPPGTLVSGEPQIR